jgi:hypothetical protein
MIIRKAATLNLRRRREVPENYGWIFVDSVPMLHDKKRLAKQLQIETWLDLTQLAKELGIEKTARKNLESAINYIV